MITADVVDGAMICLDPSRASFPEPTGVGGTRALAVPQNRSRDAVTQRETIALSNNLWSASFVKLGTPLIGSFPQFVLPVAVVAGIVAAVAVIYAKTAGDDQGPEFALRGEVGGPAGLVLYVVNGGQFDWTRWTSPSRRTATTRSSSTGSATADRARPCRGRRDRSARAAS